MTSLAATPLGLTAPAASTSSPHVSIVIPTAEPPTSKALHRNPTIAQRLGFHGLWRTLSMLSTSRHPPQIDIELGERDSLAPTTATTTFPLQDEVSDPHTPYYHRPLADESDAEILIVPGRNLKEETHAGVVGEITTGKPVWTLAPGGGPIALGSISRWVPRITGGERQRRKREVDEGVALRAVGRLGRGTRTTPDDASVPGTPRAKRGMRLPASARSSRRVDGASIFDDDMDVGVPVYSVSSLVQQGLLGVTTTASGQQILVGQSLPGQVQAAIGGGSDKKTKAESYGGALRPTGALEPRDPRAAGPHFAPGSHYYDPLALDDPLLKTGKHRTVMALPSYLSSIIQFAPRRELKDEINEQFRSLHPELDPTLTLSMIRSLKKRIADVAEDEQLELSSAALAYVYFEKLVSARRVAKINRKLVAAVCFFLAVKINDSKENADFAELLERLADEFDVSEQMIKQVEFQVYAALDFSLFVPQDEVLPHLERLMRERGMKWEDYVAEERIREPMAFPRGRGGDPWFFLGEHVG
jgi:hypothetical protein